MKLTGNGDIEESLGRLDKLTQEEARMASTELLKLTHSVDGKVMGVDYRVKGVEWKMQDVRDDVQGVGNKVQDVDVRVQGVDEKLDQANCSLSLQSLVTFQGLKQVLQGTSSEII